MHDDTVVRVTRADGWNIPALVILWLVQRALGGVVLACRAFTGVPQMSRSALAYARARELERLAERAGKH